MLVNKQEAAVTSGQRSNAIEGCLSSPGNVLSLSHPRLEEDAHKETVSVQQLRKFELGRVSSPFSITE